jgi:hypothetical protein
VMVAGADLGQPELKLQYPDDEAMRISHETIDRSPYLQARGEPRPQLTANLTRAPRPPAPIADPG